VPHVVPSALFFQFGRRDTYPTEESATRYFQAASDPKSVKWYDTGHALNDEERHDRELWLQKQVGLGKLN
jgi:predicted esterase